MREKLVGQVDVEGIDPSARQGERDIRALVAICELVGDVADLGMISTGQRQQTDLLEPGRLDPGLDHRTDGLDVAFRTGLVIMPAWQNRQPRVQPRKISTEYRSCTVSASGTSGFLGYGQASRSIRVCFATR